jgi:protein-S-isoprenylcysteine O-methyltransferase Ste14
VFLARIAIDSLMSEDLPAVGEPPPGCLQMSETRRTRVTRRILVFAYGSVAYLIFLGTFLYAMGFVGGFAMPTRLDGPSTQPFATALAVNAALLTLFAVQHSVMARKWFKEAWTRVVPPPAERSTYVLFSSLALIALFWQWRPMGGVVWSVEDASLRFVLYGLFGFGWALVLACTFLINHFDLFGLRQVWLYLTGKPYTALRFVTPGPYRMVRHPLYVGWLFAFWATPTMTVAHLVFAVATTAYILVAIQLEERDLVREHGSTYEQYRGRVPMLLPVRRRSEQEAGKRVPAAR